MGSDHPLQSIKDGKLCRVVLLQSYRVCTSVPRQMVVSHLLCSCHIALRRMSLTGVDLHVQTQHFPGSASAEQSRHRAINPPSNLAAMARSGQTHICLKAGTEGPTPLPFSQLLTLCCFGSSLVYWHGCARPQGWLWPAFMPSDLQLRQTCQQKSRRRHEDKQQGPKSLQRHIASVLSLICKEAASCVTCIRWEACPPTHLDPAAPVPCSIYPMQHIKAALGHDAAQRNRHCLPASALPGQARVRRHVTEATPVNVEVVQKPEVMGL